MKKTIPVLAFIIIASSLSCKKLVENKQRDAILDAMTNGVWMVEQYFVNEDNITYEFLNYEFQFYADGKVKALNLGTEVANGTWEADTEKYSITSLFPAATNPLDRLNYTWFIKDSYWTYVEAEAIHTAGKNFLHLRKKP